jgi:hypothetical protein
MRVDGKSCIVPPSEHIVTVQDVSLKANALGRIIADGTVAESIKVERLRQELPGIDAFERADFHLCVANANKTITNGQYNDAVMRLLPAAFLNKPSAGAAGADSQPADSVHRVVGCSRPSVAIDHPRPAALIFINESAHPVEVFWVGYDSTAQAYATLAKGERYTQSTYVSHSWCVRDRETGAVLSSAVAKEGTQEIRIK